MLRYLSSAALIAFSLSITAAHACADGESACAISNGEYFVRMPDASAKGAVVFLHGYQSSARSILNNQNLVDGIAARGYALIVPNGSDGNDTSGGSWSFAPEIIRRQRDDDRFLVDVADDASSRLNIPRERFILAGFSEGGFMTSYLACREPESFRAFTPVAGGFWRPIPEECAGPVLLYHTHGWNDGVVPLEGRWLRRPDFAQGDIFAGLEIFRESNECSDFAPDQRLRDGDNYSRIWKSNCAEGSALAFTLFPGGHQIPQFWPERVIDWFEAEINGAQ